MFTKLLAISGVARSWATRPSERLHPNSRASIVLSRREYPLRSPFACAARMQWRIDPMTGAWSAVWRDPSADPRAVTPVEQEPIDARRWFAQSRHAGRGGAAPRLAA